MREIKFRVWDETNKKWLDGHLLNVSCFWGSVHRNGSAGTINGVLLEQFTGLHDKNGKEIYEGDIVEYPTDYFTMSKQGVIYSEGHFIPLVRVEHGYNAIDNYCANDFEIIGNIHENPELLESA